MAIPSESTQRDRSASPLPPPPESSTSGPRASALQNAFTKALETTLQKCNYANFSACFPTPAQYAPDTMENFHKAFVDKLDELCRQQFRYILENRNVVQGLNGLDQLITDARLRKEQAERDAVNAGREVERPVPLHMLAPEQLLEGHLGAFVGEQHDELNKALGDLKEENGELVDRLKGQQAEIEALVRGLEAVVEDLEAAAAMVQRNDVIGLGQDVRMMESELSA